MGTIDFRRKRPIDDKNLSFDTQSAHLPATMKTTITAAAFGLLALATASAQDVLGIYNFNNIPSQSSPNNPSYVSPCIELCPIEPCGCLPQTLATYGGPDNSAYRSFTGWDQNQYDAAIYFARNEVWQWPKTVAFFAQADDQSLGFISGLNADIKRGNGTSPDTIMASIFWKDDLGTVQYRSSGPIALGAAATWANVNFDFSNSGSAALPSGLDYAGEEFLIELYAWGGNGPLALDNVTLNGQCAPIPEPGGALLVACAGFLIMLRRRRR